MSFFAHTLANADHLSQADLDDFASFMDPEQAFLSEVTTIRNSDQIIRPDGHRQGSTPCRGALRPALTPRSPTQQPKEST
ncbi:hypothetical protein ACGF0J_28150 [Nonomuraea sp. NPDC047897]|uniref:hypothetical protein n=1 Tax=Nonomuraea sp. NPDC047897 TaxID=3364346 RepID=UPI003721A138